MALQDLLDLSTSRKKIGLSEERVQAVMPIIRKYTAFWREYPDLFVGLQYEEHVQNRKKGNLNFSSISVFF